MDRSIKRIQPNTILFPSQSTYEWGGEWYENIVIHQNIGDQNLKFLGDENSHYGGGEKT